MDKHNHTFTAYLKKADELPVRVEFDHQPAEPMTNDYPGCDADVTLCEVQVNGCDILPVLTKLAQTSLRAACWEYLDALRGYDDER